MGRSSQTKQHPSIPANRSDLVRVRVIRRHHPLEGQELEVVREGKPGFLVRNPDGLAMRIPRDWTDIDGATEPPASSGTQLTIASLRDLLRLVQALEDRA